MIFIIIQFNTSLMKLTANQHHKLSIEILADFEISAKLTFSMIIMRVILGNLSC